MQKMAEEMPNYLAAETLSENMTKPTSEQKIFGFQNPKTKSAIERWGDATHAACAVHNFLTRVSGMKVNFIFFYIKHVSVF